MSSYCKGICKSDKSSQLRLGYSNGQKFCTTCSYYWITTKVRCYCCSNKLRTSPKYNRDKFSTECMEY